ncbi:HsdR family type I site-specific deoxyribonuclease [Luteimonas sp. MC1572]|uniref:type I restriction endonuclease subunit R n=1 Tax=Luteimonas sp. MC1572 TaxID=2799325 RepID=UPI0018F07B9E|nr:HsdR family type I site-specific deoxyribonuclease [Luteimonas sp. MC1572]MBJ6981670.1 type I restriction endonuclease subunit R [Luteimonas sp. MC1572]QQO02962.1 type I restriction endonuclease subunit R [Luteimonas sp. MC1572]
MPSRPRAERTTQNRVVELFTDKTRVDCLGYDYLGDWGRREVNRSIEPEYLSANLKKRGYSDAQISEALRQLLAAAEISANTLYDANLKTYSLLRYGADVQTALGEPIRKVHFIDWTSPDKNDFALAEEVTLRGDLVRRPDIVLYINGIAIAVIELKRSSRDMAEGIRQLISNQEKQFNEGFFSTAQLLLAGSDSQGIYYGTVGSLEEFYVRWKDEAGLASGEAGVLLDRPLAQLFDKARLLDFLYNFVIFDGGIKKVPRQHQYAGIKAAQERTGKREGGVIWHTQGSGKSILMVLLAKWLLEDDPTARILVITDRDELDEQISRVLKNAGLDSSRVTSRADLVDKLGATTPRLLCALLHKFDTTDLAGLPPPVHGRFYVFVDEAHRTQGGDMNKQMKRWLGDAIFIGFTGTPLLRKDKQTTHEVFGTYIHTYKFPEAVADKVVLDLRYEAREVPQELGSKAKIKDYFDKKTKHLNKFQQAALRKRWATMEELLSSKERKDRIINSILEDFDTRRRLNDGRGTAILVADEIYDACHYFRLFQNTEFGKHVGVITSFEPDRSQYSKEPAGSDYRYKYDTYKDWVLDGFDSTDKYETEMKRRFKDEPANCKLLIVVSKLLTGFDAPSCSYIYLDRNLRDHDLFQAICRTNRLDGDDKDFGFIVDFKELYGKVQEAISVYSSDQLEVDSRDGQDGNVTLKNWIAEGTRKLEESREALLHLCEPVLAPRDLEQFIGYFCGESQDAEALEQSEPLRISFYKLVTAFVRAWADIGSELASTGYDDAKIARLEKEVAFYAEMRAAIKNHSGEEFDVKPFEGDMRDLLNRYVKADDARALGDMGDLSLVDLIVKTGIHDAIAQKLNAKGASNKAVAEGIINNVRKAIIQERLTDPRFFTEMASLLEDLIQQSHDDAKDYEEFLKQAEALARKLAAHASGGEQAPEALHGRPEAIVVYRNLPDILARPVDAKHVAQVATLHESELISKAVQIDTAMRESVPADWKGNQIKEQVVRSTLLGLVDGDRAAMLRLFELVKNQAGYR